MSNYVNRFKPKLYEGNETIEGLYNSQSDEVEKIHYDTKRIVNNSFIKTADGKGISRFEELLEMKGNAKYTLEQRRENVLNKMLFVPPFTRQKLNEILYNIYGRGGYVFDVYPNEFRVIIDINTTDPIVYLQLNKDVRYIIPANMELIFAIQYTYLYLNRNKTYTKMSELSYNELSKYSQEA